MGGGSRSVNLLYIILTKYLKQATLIKKNGGGAPSQFGLFGLFTSGKDFTVDGGGIEFTARQEA